MNPTDLPWTPAYSSTSSIPATNSCSGYSRKPHQRWHGDQRIPHWDRGWSWASCKRPQQYKWWGIPFLRAGQPFNCQWLGGQDQLGCCETMWKLWICRPQCAVGLEGVDLWPRDGVLVYWQIQRDLTWDGGSVMIFLPFLPLPILLHIYSHFSFWHTWTACCFISSFHVDWCCTLMAVLINCTQLVGSPTVMLQPHNVQPPFTFLLFKP